MAKQLASWLKEADKAAGFREFSITGLVFIFDGDNVRATIFVCPTVRKDVERQFIKINVEKT